MAYCNGCNLAIAPHERSYSKIVDGKVVTFHNDGRPCEKLFGQTRKRLKEFQEKQARGAIAQAGAPALLMT